MEPRSVTSSVTASGSEATTVGTVGAGTVGTGTVGTVGEEAVIWFCNFIIAKLDSMAKLWTLVKVSCKFMITSSNICIFSSKKYGVNGGLWRTYLLLVMQRHLKSSPVDFRLTFWACRLTFYFLSVVQFFICYDKASRSFLVNRPFFFFRSFYPKGTNGIFC